MNAPSSAGTMQLGKHRHIPTQRRREDVRGTRRDNLSAPIGAGCPALSSANLSTFLRRVKPRGRAALRGLCVKKITVRTESLRLSRASCGRCRESARDYGSHRGISLFGRGAERAGAEWHSFASCAARREFFPPSRSRARQRAHLSFLHRILHLAIHPAGTNENSPALQCWVCHPERSESRRGRQNCRRRFLPSPAGLAATSHQPSAEALGYFHSSLRDGNPGRSKSQGLSVPLQETEMPPGNSGKDCRWPHSLQNCATRTAAARDIRRPADRLRAKSHRPRACPPSSASPSFLASTSRRQPAIRRLPSASPQAVVRRSDS